ncbi:DUF5667 domain-containing protein [Streptomyces sp. NPDC018031]|uniref:DUF5667 domain-containing protein n=1 Tax=Streptomyces sp. NPDC018031 TaxID=3365033 RepID=UPI0037B46715
MIANVSAHRRANAFAQALEAQEQQLRDLQDATAEQSGPSADDAERARMLALASGLGRLPVPELRAEVRTEQRAQLVAAMEAAFAEGSPRVPGQRSGRGAHRAKPLGRFRPKSRLSKGLAAGGLTVGVAAGALGGVAAASSDALPGDTLYGLKRGMEDLKLGMADGDVERGRLYLDQASTRMSEARRLMERARAGELDQESVGEVRRALSGMRHDAAEGHRLLTKAYQQDGSLSPMESLSSFSASHRAGWTKLSEALPVQLTDVRDEVSSVFDAIEDEVQPLRSLLPVETGRGSAGRTPARDGARPPASKHTEAASPGSGDAGTGRTATADGDSPRPSASEQPERQGLLDGADRLLTPPDGTGLQLPTSGGSAGTAKPSEPARPDALPTTDVTLPPLLPGLLPGLGISGEEAP